MIALQSIGSFLIIFTVIALVLWILSESANRQDWRRECREIYSKCSNGSLRGNIKYFESQLECKDFEGGWKFSIAKKECEDELRERGML